MDEKGKNLLRAPIFDGPSIATCEISSQSSPSSTFGPMTQYGPTLQEEGTRAEGSMTAVGWTFKLTDPNPSYRSHHGRASELLRATLFVLPRSAGLLVNSVRGDL